MRLQPSLRLIPIIIATVATAAVAQPQKVGAIFQRGGDAIVITPCPAGGDHDENCRAVEARSGRQVRKLGSGYIIVRTLWRRPTGGVGPDIILFGDNGGSGGNGDLFAVTFGRDTQVRTLSGERMDSATVTPGRAGPRITLAFDIEFFNGAPHAGAIIVPLPVRWTNGDFALDPAALVRPALSPIHETVRVAAMTRELREWLAARQNPAVLYPPESPSGTPVTAKTLVETMLAGHADRARAMLDRSWPRRNGGSPGGEERFWADLCHAFVAQPLWGRFDLRRLPHADLIVAGAEHGAG